MDPIQSKPVDVPLKAKRKMNESRLMLVEAALRVGKTTAQIEITFAKAWECSRRQVRRYVRAVLARMVAHSEETREFRRTELVLQVENVLKEAVENKDHSVVLAAVDRLMRMHGVAEPEKVKGEVEVRLPAGFKTDAEARAYLAQHAATALAAPRETADEPAATDPEDDAEEGEEGE